MPDATAAPRLRILLAENQAATRDLVGLGLGRLNCRIESVASAGEALARMRDDLPDLILLSTTLPDMPGVPLIGALRALPGAGQVPIVAICASDPEARQACTAAGAAACVGHPIEVEHLASLIEGVVQPGAGPAAREPVLDLDHLREFTDGDPQLEGELSALFLSSAEMYVREMRDALRGGGAWTPIAHALKGASGNLGARRVAALALEAERSEPSRAQLEAIERALDQVRALFEGGSANGSDRPQDEQAAGSRGKIP